MCRLLGPLSRFLFCDVVFYRYTLTWLLVCETSTFIRALWNCIHLKQRPGHLIKSCFKVCLGTAQYIQDSRTLRPSYKLYWGHGAFVVLVRISLLLHFIADWCRSGVLFKACICAGISVMVCLHPCSGTTFIGQYSTLKILRVLKADSHCILVLVKSTSLQTIWAASRVNARLSCLHLLSRMKGKNMDHMFSSWGGFLWGTDSRSYLVQFFLPL